MDLNKSNDYFDSKDIESNRIAAVLSYFGILVIVTLLIAPNSKFARYHANQGVCLLICEVVFGIARGILVGIFGFIPLIGAIVSGVLSLFGLAFLILSILGIANAAKGEAKELPFVGQFNLIK